MALRSTFTVVEKRESKCQSFVWKVCLSPPSLVANLEDNIRAIAYALFQDVAELATCFMRHGCLPLHVA